jgi:hypothetical protein
MPPRLVSYRVAHHGVVVGKLAKDPIQIIRVDFEKQRKGMNFRR